MSEPRQGLVVRSTAGFVDVRVDGKVIQCRIRGRLKNVPRGSDLCVIGDQVVVERADARTHVVAQVLPRRRRFSRQQPGRGPRKEDVLVANLDQLLVTFSYGSPLYNARLLDRFLVIAEHQGVQPIIVMNKADLAQPGDSGWHKTYESIGYPVLMASAETGEGIDALRETLGGKISAFVGPSGVGKSSIINRILPSLDLNVASVSDHHGKGRHTTRVASLHAIPGGGFLADTPGIRELATWALPVDQLDLCFPEFTHYRPDCAFRSCSHTHEPQCAIRDAVHEGTIDADRYESYVRLREDASG